jgi:hypothetical protein
MPLSALFSLFRRQAAPAAAAAPAPVVPPAGIDHLRSGAGLGPPEVAEPEPPPEPILADGPPPDPTPPDAQRPDSLSPGAHPADPASPEIQPADLAWSEVQPADPASPDVQPADLSAPGAHPADPASPEDQATDATPPVQQLTCEMFIEQAELAGKAGNWPAAEMIWRSIRTVIPQYWPSYAGGAAALCSLGRLDEARQLLDQGMALFPEDAPFRWSLAAWP